MRYILLIQQTNNLPVDRLILLITNHLAVMVDTSVPFAWPCISNSLSVNRFLYHWLSYNRWKWCTQQIFLRHIHSLIWSSRSFNRSRSNVGECNWDKKCTKAPITNRANIPIRTLQLRRESSEFLYCRLLLQVSCAHRWGQSQIITYKVSKVAVSFTIKGRRKILAPLFLVARPNIWNLTLHQAYSTKMKLQDMPFRYKRRLWVITS